MRAHKKCSPKTSPGSIFRYVHCFPCMLIYIIYLRALRKNAFKLVAINKFVFVLCVNSRQINLSLTNTITVVSKEIRCVSVVPTILLIKFD